MSLCRECGNENSDPNGLFCRQCGAKLEKEPETSEAQPSGEPEGKCPGCGEINESGAAFCSNCGTKLAAVLPSAAPTAPPAPPAAPAPTAAAPPVQPQKQVKPKKKHTGLIIFLIFLLLLLAAAGGVFAYAYLAGPETLPVIGQFFAEEPQRKPSDLDEEAEEDDAEEDDAKEEGAEEDDALEPEDSEYGEVAPPKPAEAPPAGSPEVVTATSELPGFPAENVVDGKNDTAWASERDRSGFWGSVTIPFGSDVTLYGINIKNGFWKSQFELIRNSRAKELVVKFDDGSIETLTVADSTLSDFSALTASDGDALIFSQPHTSSTITITVLDAYLGAEEAVYITGISVILTPVPAPREAAPLPAAPLEPVVISGSDVLYVQTSSVLPSQSGHYYGAENLLDGNIQTVWSEGVSGGGAGEWIELTFARPLTLNGIEIFNGHGGSRALFDANGKVTVIMIETSEGSWTERYVSSNLFDYETIFFDYPVTTDWLLITILSATGGTRYEDTCISEIRLITGVMTGDYILPFSSARPLTDSDLRYLSKDELRYARNEIYARYGRQFNDNELQAYFNTKAWYIMLPKLPVGREPTLTKLELSNVDLIRMYEER